MTTDDRALADLIEWRKQLLALPIEGPVPEDLDRAIRLRFNTARDDLMSGDSGNIIHRPGHGLDLILAIEALERPADRLEAFHAKPGIVIDLDAEFWGMLKEAANQSTWLPPEYMMNDWVSDCASFLRDGPAALQSPPPVVSESAGDWIARNYPSAVDTAGADRLVAAFEAGRSASTPPVVEEGRREAAAAFDRREQYIAMLLNALAPFSAAAETCDAKNADRVDGSRAQPWNYVDESHFRDAFSAYTEKLDPDDAEWIRSAILALTPVEGVGERQNKPSDADRREWLIQRLLYGIQFYVYANAKAAEVEELIDSLDEGTAYDTEAAALVQIPKWAYASEAQGAVDAALSTPVAAQGDEVRDLWSLEQRLTDGEFFSDYDEDLRLLGVFRRHVATLKDSSHEGG